MIYQLELKQYELLYSNINDEIICERIKSSEVIDNTICKLGLAKYPIVTFELIDEDKIFLVDFFSDEMMIGYPRTDQEKQTELSQVYEGLMYMLIQL